MEGEGVYPLSLYKNFQSKAANAAPIRGAIMKSQSCSMATPPTNIAGPKLLAGLTEVPSTAIPKRWITVSEKPMATPAKPGVALLLVDPRITKRKMKVKTTSKTKADVMEKFAGD